MSARAAVRRWPLFLIASPAAVGRVGLGGLCGFGPIHPLPGIADSFTLNTAITLPVGVEGYGACALRAWLTPGVPARAQGFARKSAIGALALGMCGQVIYHLLDAAHAAQAPWPVVVLVSCRRVTRPRSRRRRIPAGRCPDSGNRSGAATTSPEGTDHVAGHPQASRIRSAHLPQMRARPLPLPLLLLITGGST